MNSKWMSLLLMFVSTGLNAQLLLKQSDWQQTVDYKISVKLNDQNHTLTGDLTLKYTNNSPNELTEIYMHIWPNAYANRNTAFAKQQLTNGSTTFHYADDSERGYIDSLNFKIGSQSVQCNLLPDQSDVCVLKLNQPLRSGQSIDITTPFYVKIPGSFSRFGHEGQDYQITQWFPKPAVYDVNGWNPISYLDQGEFYSEFGKFEVKITVPQNYVVAATGVLQEASEWQFIRQRRDNPLKVFDGIVSSAETKTLTYIQDNIHDFAWFASKYFNVQEDVETLKNGSQVGTFIYAPTFPVDGTRYIGKALQYYSNNCGLYPYKYCTAVQGPLKAGGGMEYPMITVVVDVDEEVVVHEVGHNWFYGILGSNERTYPWMDESINSYFEAKTIGNAIIGNGTLEKPSASIQNLNGLIMDKLSVAVDRIRMNQPIGATSEEFNSGNYGLMVYGKGAKAFGYLHAYLGEQTFFDCFRAYYDKWSFKHPLPGDMQTVFDSVSGMDLSWFFNDMLKSEGVLDYKVKSLKKNGLQIENKGDINGPYAIGLFYQGELQLEIWQEGHPGLETVVIAEDTKYDLVKLDPYGTLPEVQQRNNTIRKNGLFKKVEPFRIGFLGGLENPNRTTLYVSPILGYNIYNKMMLGLYLGNASLPPSNLKIFATPLYSFETSDLNGYANISYQHSRNAKLSGIEYGVKSARFAYKPMNLDFTFNRIAPFVSFKFRSLDKRKTDRSTLTFRYTNTSFTPKFDEDKIKESLVYNPIGLIQTYEKPTPNYFLDAIWFHKNGKALNPFSYRINVQLGHATKEIFQRSFGQISSLKQIDDFAKLNLTFNQHLNYAGKKKGLDVRLFAGTYLKTPDDGLYQYRLSTQSGMYDYVFEESLIGRGATTGLFKNQVLNTDMFFKQPGNFGNLSSWVGALNITSTIPGKLPVNVYLDLFTYNIIAQGNRSDFVEIGYSGGLALRIFPEVFEIYFPFATSQFITDTQKLQGIENYGQKITFMLKLNFLGKLSLEDLLGSAF